jgi:hypothetical protein
MRPRRDFTGKGDAEDFAKAPDVFLQCAACSIALGGITLAEFFEDLLGGYAIPNHPDRTGRNKAHPGR